MPIFEYACQNCGHQFAKLQLGRSTPDCPSCHSVKLEKRFSAFAIGPSSGRTAPAAAPGACGTCRDQRGPGACAPAQ